MKHILTLITTLLLAPLAALHAAEPPRKIGDVHAPLWVGRPPSDAVSGLVRLENGYDYGIDPTPELRSHPDFLPTSYVFSRDQGLTWETQKVPKGHYGADARSRSRASICGCKTTKMVSTSSRARWRHFSNQ